MERKKNRSNFKAKLKTAMFCWSYLNRQKYLPFRWILNGIWCTHEIQFMGKKTRRKSQREKKNLFKTEPKHTNFTEIYGIELFNRLPPYFVSMFIVYIELFDVCLRLMFKSYVFFSFKFCIRSQCFFFVSIIVFLFRRFKIKNLISIIVVEIVRFC